MQNLILPIFTNGVFVDEVYLELFDKCRNLHLSTNFLDLLISKGCKLVIFVEFVPVTEESRELAPGNEDLRLLKDGIANLREKYPIW